MFIESETNTSMQNVKQNILYYLQNSKIEHFSSGTYGIIKKSTLLDEPTSTSTSNPTPNYFLSLNADVDVVKNKRSKHFTHVEQYKKPIKTLIIKICLIDMDDEDEAYPNNIAMKPYFMNDPTFEDDKKQPKLMNCVNEKVFKNEVNVQTDIYLKTMKFAQPICPAIIHSEIITDTRTKKTTRTINPEDAQILQLLEIPIFDMKEPLSYGLIFMEFIDGYDTFENFKIPSSKTKKSFTIILLWTLIQLTLETGYSHGDHHFNNILITNKYPKGGYFDGNAIRILLIDFGRASKVPLKQLHIFKTLCQNKKYTDALMLLSSRYKNEFGKNVYTTNEYVSNYAEHRNIYGWAFGSYGGKLTDKEHKNKLFVNKHTENTNELIHNIFALREIAINKNVITMRRLHLINPMVYPLLPLSNSVKNKLFNGIDNVIQMKICDIKALGSGSSTSKPEIYLKHIKRHPPTPTPIPNKTTKIEETIEDESIVETFLNWDFFKLF
jgi:hypothetical protein